MTISDPAGTDLPLNPTSPQLLYVDAAILHVEAKMKPQV
jgi:hypothetical protein